MSEHSPFVGKSFVAEPPEVRKARESRLAEFDQIVWGKSQVDQVEQMLNESTGSTAVLETVGRPRRKRTGGRVVAGLGIAAMVLGGVIAAAGVLFPQQVEQAYGEMKTELTKHASQAKEAEFTEQTADLVDESGTLDLGSLEPEEREQVREAAQQAYPTVTLGVHGDKTELNRCDHTFTIMGSYERDGVPPTGAAHNNCGGDVLLYWEDGQRVNLTGLGYDGLYEVVDIRHTSKIWSSTDDLVGLGGDIALQSCFYGVDEMKFVGLQKIEGL